MRNLNKIPRYIARNTRRGRDRAKIWAAMWAAMTEHEKAMGERFISYLKVRK